MTKLSMKTIRFHMITGVCIGDLDDIFPRPDRSYVLWKACIDGRCG